MDKKNVLNDNVKNAKEQQDLSKTLRMPEGIKKHKKS